MSLPRITVFSIFGTHRLHESVQRVMRVNPSNPISREADHLR
jgi:hypothetical protein